MADETTPEGDGFAPITSQEELNKVIGERLAREREKFGDYGELKKKAAQFDELKVANQSDLEKAVSRADAAEAKVAAFEQRDQVTAWATEIVGDSGVPASALRGSTREELEAHFEQLKPLLVPPVPPKRVSTPPGQAAPGETGSRAANALRLLSTT